MELYVHGLAGIEPQLYANTVKLTPRIPKKLDFYEVRDVRLADHRFTLRVDRLNHTVSIAHNAGAQALIFAVNLPDGTSRNVPLEPNAKLTLNWEE